MAAEPSSSISHLAASSVWQKLLHYSVDKQSPSGMMSDVQSHDFFFSIHGRYDPTAELEATIKAMRAEVGDDINAHAQCRFPARFQWLKTQGLIQSNAKSFSCPIFNSWIDGSSTTSLSLIYATGYLGNPASYYGHMLLKFNSEGRSVSDLLDVSVNYGAVIPQNVNPLEYIYKGATGGFDAGFSDIEYYFHDHHYGDVELRDLWEYELNLSAKDVMLIKSHAWELLGRKFTYYFFKENCAYRVAELLELVSEDSVLPENRPWTVPQTILENLNNNHYQGKKLVKKVTKHESRQNQFFRHYLALGTDEKQIVKKFVENESARIFDLLSGLDDKVQLKVVDTLINYYRYSIRQAKDNVSTKQVRYDQLLAYRFRLPSNKSEILQANSKGPELGRKPGFMNAEAIHNSELGGGFLMRIRPAYYDTLDSSSAQVPNSSLSMLELSFDYFNGDIDLREFYLFKVEAVNSSVSGLAGDNGKVWLLSAGLVQQDLLCDDCLVPKFEGKYGGSFSLGSTLVGLSLGGALQENRYGQGAASLTTTVFLNMTRSEKFRSRVIYESKYGVGGSWTESIKFESRVRLTTNSDLRLRAEKSEATEIGLSLGYYW